jgi:hypothetical protein
MSLLADQTMAATAARMAERIVAAAPDAVAAEGLEKIAQARRR